MFFFQGKMRVKGGWSPKAYSSLLFRRLCLCFFFQEKEKQKEKQKRRHALLLLLFSVFFSFLKKAKRQGKRQVWRSRIFFFLHFWFVFCKKNKKKKSKERRTFFWLFFLFFRNKKRRRGEARRLAGRLSPPVRSEKLCKKESKKMRTRWPEARNLPHAGECGRVHVSHWPLLSKLSGSAL